MSWPVDACGARRWFGRAHAREEGVVVHVLAVLLEFSPDVTRLMLRADDVLVPKEAVFYVFHSVS